MTKNQAAMATCLFLRTPWGASAATAAAGAAITFAPVVAIAAVPLLGVCGIGWCVKKVFEAKTD